MNGEPAQNYLLSPGGYIWFVLPPRLFDDLPQSLEVEGTTFHKKDEFHVTVINARSVMEAAQASDISAEELFDMLLEYVADSPIQFEGFTNDIRLAVSAPRMSLAARCMMKNFEGYFEQVNAKYVLKLPLQPAHVSLYALPGERAVGIDSVVEMESFKKLELPEIQNVLDSVK